MYKNVWTFKYKLYIYIGCRDVAQSGRALRSGRRGRAFESRHPDHFLSGDGPGHFKDWQIQGNDHTPDNTPQKYH